MAAWLSAAILVALLTAPVVVRLVDGDRKAAPSETRSGRVNVSAEADVFRTARASVRLIPLAPPKPEGATLIPLATSTRRGAILIPLVRLGVPSAARKPVSEESAPERD
jgi:hypothetical protein